MRSSSSSVLLSHFLLLVYARSLPFLSSAPLFARRWVPVIVCFGFELPSMWHLTITRRFMFVQNILLSSSRTLCCGTLSTYLSSFKWITKTSLSMWSFLQWNVLNKLIRFDHFLRCYESSLIIYLFYLISSGKKRKQREHEHGKFTRLTRADYRPPVAQRLFPFEPTLETLVEAATMRMWTIN